MSCEAFGSEFVKGRKKRKENRRETDKTIWGKSSLKYDLSPQGRRSLLGQKQKTVHSRESLWQNKNLLRGKKKTTEFSLSPGIICLPVLHNAFSHSHAQNIPETAMDTGKTKASQESSLKSLQVPGKDTGMKQLGHLRSVSSRTGRAQDQDCQGSESSRSSLHGPAPEQGPKDMDAGVKETSFCYQWALQQEGLRFTKLPEC